MHSNVAAVPSAVISMWLRAHAWASAFAARMRIEADMRAARQIAGCLLLSTFAQWMITEVQAQTVVNQPPDSVQPSEPTPWIEKLCMPRDRARIKADEDRKQQKAAAQLQLDGSKDDDLQLRLVILKADRESREAERFRAIAFEICDPWIRYHYQDPNVADQLIAIRASVDRQKDVAVRSFWDAYRWQQLHQWGLVVLAFLATILSAWASRSVPAQGEETGKWGVTKPQTFSFLAMVSAAIVTAMGTMANFYDLQGSVERHAKVWNAMGVLQSRIDDQLMADVAQKKTPDTLARIMPWAKERDSALKQANEEWTNALKAKGQ